MTPPPSGGFRFREALPVVPLASAARPPKGGCKKSGDTRTQAQTPGLRKRGAAAQTKPQHVSGAVGWSLSEAAGEKQPVVADHGRRVPGPLRAEAHPAAETAARFVALVASYLRLNGGVKWLLRSINARRGVTDNSSSGKDSQVSGSRSFDRRFTLVGWPYGTRTLVPSK